jgi:methylmalonyl-CoA mutase cobalamin-binding subunit
MANTYKRLGAINPSANTQTNVYVVPAATSAVVSTITICNQSASNASYSLALMSASEFNAAAPTATYIIRGGVVPPADTIAISIGLTANANSVLVANVSSASISVGAFGSEIS